MNDKDFTIQNIELKINSSLGEYVRCTFRDTSGNDNLAAGRLQTLGHDSTWNHRLIFLTGCSRPPHPLIKSHNKYTFLRFLSGKHFINSGLMEGYMGRKKSKKAKPGPTAVECNLCATDVWQNDPALGIIYMIGEKHAALCKECGECLVRVMALARQRWG